MTIPHRGRTSESTYFVTANVLERKCLFHVEKIARLFIEVLLSYRAKQKYLLHEFVVMPDHIHLTPHSNRNHSGKGHAVCERWVLLPTQQRPKAKERPVAAQLCGQAHKRFSGV